MQNYKKKSISEGEGFNFLRKREVEKSDTGELKIEGVT